MIRLLIVDDEQIIRESMSEIIDYASLGYELIGTAKNGMEAYDIICDEYPDVVITDIRMPILNGLELIEKAQKTDRHIAFILLSGYGEFEYAQKAMRYGVRHYLLKPTRKQELIDTLVSVEQEVTSQKMAQQTEQKTLLHSLRGLLQQSFLMEALGQNQEFPALFEKYLGLRALEESCCTACFFYFVEEAYLGRFAADVRRIFQEMGIEESFPIIYVKNTAIAIAPLDRLVIQETFRERFLKLQYVGQRASFELEVVHREPARELFSYIVKKISRYERIVLLGEETHEISNSLTSPTQLSRLADSIRQAGLEAAQDALFLALFPDGQELQSAKNLAVSLFLQMNAGSERSVDFACDFFRKLYSCQEMETIRTLLRTALFQGQETTRGKVDNITLLKQYVDQHLGSESLSLKWLAEQFLFVDVGHLSKQFVKKEGVRFSEYLNKKRMDEAIHLMVYYKNDNIKDIARQVGFRNNPQYFSQVFKKYTGYTPSDYLEALKTGQITPLS